jgi:hypothetical protein
MELGGVDGIFTLGAIREGTRHPRRKGARKVVG